MTEKNDIFFYVGAAVFCFMMAVALVVGDLQHGWSWMWSGIPIGFLTGCTEIIIAVACGAFLSMKIWREK